MSLITPSPLPVLQILISKTLEFNHLFLVSDVVLCIDLLCIIKPLHNDTLLCFHVVVCEFEMSGPDGIAESVMVTKEGKALQTEAVDCRWFIRAPPGSKVKLPSQLKLKPSMVALG